MYESYFGFREMPFSVTPDPHFFYTNDLYERAFSALRYGIIWKKGLILLTGEVGTGKSTLLRKLMGDVEATAETIYVFYTFLSFDELVQLMLEDAGLSGKGKSRLEMFREFSEDLVRQFENGRTVALLIDEAQNLSDEALEGLRLLSNLQVNNEKVLQIVLVGQPELHEKLDKPSMRPLQDRVAIRCRLDSLTHSEVGDYIRHRLRVAGYDGPEIFSTEAVECIGTYSRGKPRLINILCDNALILAYRASSKKVSADMVVDAAGDLGLEANIQVAKARIRELDQRSPSAANANGAKDIKTGNATGDLGLEPNLQVGNVEVRGLKQGPPGASNDNEKKAIKNGDTAGDSGLEPNIQIGNVKVRRLEKPPQGASNDNGQEAKKRGEQRLEALPLDTPEARSQQARPVVGSERHTVPREFFYTMTQALAEAMGPMASVVITDQISALGESDNAFPIAKLGQLVDLVSRSILNQAMKADFQDFIGKEIYRYNRLSSEWTNIVD